MVAHIVRCVLRCLPKKPSAAAAAASSDPHSPTAPLVFDDADLLPELEELFDAKVHAEACAAALAAHPGSFAFVRLAGSRLDPLTPALASCFASLAAKGVEELAFVAQPWPLDATVPAELLRCSGLRRLHLGICHFPDTSEHPPAFTGLRELALLHAIIAERDLEAVLRHCTALEKLVFVLTYAIPQVRVASPSLRCLAVWLSPMEAVDVEDAPSLERFVIQGMVGSTCVRVGHAPQLVALGYLEPRYHEFQLGDTIVKPMEGGDDSIGSDTLPSLKILGLKVRFDEKECRMVPNLLRCFPCLETLHIWFCPSKSPDEDMDLDFWNQVGRIECLESITTICLEAVQCTKAVHAFLEFLFARTKALKLCRLVCANSSCNRENIAQLKAASDAAGGPAAAPINIEIRTYKGEEYLWDYHSAVDLSGSDPFVPLN